MKLLFVIDHFGSGGAQRQMVLLAAGMDDLGHTVEFFIYHPGQNFYRPGLDKRNIRIHTYEKKNRFSLKVLNALYRVVKNGDFDCVLSFLDTPNLYAEVIRFIYPRTPLVVSMRMSPPGRWPAKDRIRLQFHRRADHITVNSKHQRHLLENQFCWVAEKVTTIFNGVDVQEFAPGPEVEFPETLQGHMNLLAIGRIAEQKNLMGLVDALRLFRERHHWIPKVRWAGKDGGGADEMDYYIRVKGAIHRAGLDDSWEWLGERRDISVLLNHSDALIHPALYEGLPNAVCEALAAGCPVLAGSICDNPFLVNHGITGLLFDPKQPADIAEAMSAYASLSIDERRAMRQNARDYALKELSLSRYARGYEKVFKRMTGR